MTFFEQNEKDRPVFCYWIEYFALSEHENYITYIGVVLIIISTGFINYQIYKTYKKNNKIIYDALALDENENSQWDEASVSSEESEMLE